VPEAGHGLGLGPEASDFLRIERAASRDHLQSHQPVQTPLPGPIDNPHSPLTDVRQDFITGQRWEVLLLPRREGSRWLNKSGRIKVHRPGKGR
jgi:hypothetical protein